MRTRLLPILVALGGLIAPATASAAVSHLVAPGETLTSVAAVDGLSITALATANGLSPNAELIAGGELVIPPRGLPAPTVPLAEPAASSALGAPSAGASVYRVRRGDTLSAIAVRFGVSETALAAANGMSVDGLLLAGRTLAIDGQGAASPPADAAPVTLAPSAPAAEMVSPDDVGAAAERAGVPSALAEAVADQESGFNEAELSATGAEGVMQIEPGTASYVHDVLGVPELGTGAATNLAEGAALLHELLAQTGYDEPEAIAAYYQGLRSVREHGMYPDTERYVDDVTALESRFGG